MENEVIRRIAWSGILAGCGAIASIAAHKVAEQIYIKLFGEEPPE